METVSSVYLEGMGNMVRKPSRMRLTFHYTYPDPEGDVIYTNRDIVKVTEKKTAHLIAGELPAVELEMELVNLDGSFNPNDISGLHDLIVKGVPVTYEFGYDIPNLQYYGYTDGEEHDYGMEENVPYGFMEGYATEWIPGGEVITSGEISYSKTTATISAKDHLSFLDEHVLFAYGKRTLAQVAKGVLLLTDYPKEDDGDPKIITGPELDAFNTAITLSETEDESISAKEHLQTIAHACGVQMYIDRGGYIHLDNDKRGVSAVYGLPLGQQGEAPEHRKEQMPKKVVITLNSEYGDPVETDLNGGGETMTVENPFIVTTAEGETLSEIVYDHFIKYRNTADVPYRGEPALDILDTISLGTEFGGDVEAIVVGTELEFDGTLSGSLSVRYQLGGNTPEKVQIKGSGNFIYPLGEGDEPSVTSFNLLCETTFDAPTYQWSYFTVSNGSWLNIAGATSNTLTVAYDSSYYNNDSSVKFRCVVNGVKGAITQISKIQLQKSETSGYRGAVVATSPASIDVPSPQIGDVVLLDNTTDGTAEVYGEAHVYNGEAWVATEESDALAMTYKDALQLAEDSGKTIYASEIYADLIVTKRLRVQSGNFLAKINETDGVDVTYGANKLFKVEPLTGNIYFGEHFWYEPADGAIHTPNNKTVIKADGTIEAVGGTFSGNINADSGTIKGQLDTITLQTILGGDTEYPKGNMTTIESLVTAMVNQGVFETDQKATGTINSKTIKFARTTNITIDYAQRRTSGKVLWETHYKYASTIICTVGIVFTMTDNTTIAFAIRKIETNIDPYGYPEYPTPPTTLSQLFAMADFQTHDEWSGQVPSAPTQSAYDDIPPLRAFPYTIYSLSLYDSTQERFYIRNLPTNPPAESERIWNDSGTLKIVP